LGKDKLIQELFQKIEVLTSRLEKAEQEISELKTENTDLKARLNSNSKNSSRPPSSDGYQKKPAFPKKKDGKQGGQPGHKGRTLHQVDNPDKIVICKPNSCTCGHNFKDEDLVLSEKRQVFDLPKPKLEITEYQIHKAVCPECGLTHKGLVPQDVNAPVQYGNGVKAYCVLLNVHFKLPFKKIQLLFGDLFGYSINESTVYSGSEQCFEKLGESEKIIKSKVAENNVTHADETGLRVSGKLHWLHTATTLLYTYLFVHEKRGGEALKSDKSILNDFTGWLVHDCWGSYFTFTGFQHAICGAHILRELQGLIDNGKSKWAKDFKAFFMSVYEMPFEERIKKQNQLEARYMFICNMGEKSEPPPMKTVGKRGRYKRTKGRNLVERLIREKLAVMAFAFNQEVPFTNNLAERDIRPAKVKQKISNCFRTFKGAEIYARIESFVSTARKNNKDVFSELCTTFEGHNFITREIG
jgi:transposase